MQLNSLSLNSHQGSTFSNSELPIYDHKLARIHDQIFVFGKNYSNFTIQSPLHKINISTLKIQPILVINFPVFSHFIMFSHKQLLYFWGQIEISQKYELYEFDGLKFTILSQNGFIPNLGGQIYNCIFSHHFLLIFGGYKQNQCLKKWNVFNIKTRTWYDAHTTIQLPICQTSSLIWLNGRGYLLLVNAYFQEEKRIQKNILYEIKFKNFESMTLQIDEIKFSTIMNQSEILFENILSLEKNTLILLGGYESFINKKEFKNQDQKQYYYLNLQTYEWSDCPSSIHLKGQNYQIQCYEQKLYCIGGNYKDEILKNPQVFSFENYSIYEQSKCYDCSQSFTYRQKYAYQPLIEKQYQSFHTKIRIQNKFIRKISQTIHTQFQAISILCDFLVFMKSEEIQINLVEQIGQKLKFSKFYNYPTQVLVLTGINHKNTSIQDLDQCFKNMEKNQQISDCLNELNMQIIKLKIGSFKIGFGMLFVTKTKQNSLFIGYSSLSSTDLPQTSFRAFSTYSYIISLKENSKQIQFSSQINRSIIYQNVKLYFQRPEMYEKTAQYFKSPSKKTQISRTFIYIFGSNKLSKCQNFLALKNNYCDDIYMNTMDRKNPSNSLTKYLNHLYIESQISIKLEGNRIEYTNIYHVFQINQKNKWVSSICIGDELNQSNELEQTHFTQTHDQIMHWKKIDIVQKCKLYQIKEKKNKGHDPFYFCIFVYVGKRFLKVMRTKNCDLCGIVEISDKVNISLSSNNFEHKKDQLRIKQWLEYIQLGCLGNQEINYQNI